jgi:hypothetical protein
MEKIKLSLIFLLLFIEPSFSSGSSELARNNLDSLVTKTPKVEMPAWKKDITKFDLQTWKTTFNKSFASVLGATGPNNQIGNYATLDPLNGSFTLKGLIPIQKSSRNINFLSVALKGALLSDKTSQLFKQGKINTNSSIKVDYHFLMKIYPNSILVLKESEAAYIVNHSLLANDIASKMNAINMD